MKHKHHIIPKHMGGTDDPSNIIEVSVEQHAELHLALYLEHGLKEDWLAYRGLAGIISHEDAVREAQRLGVSKANAERIWTDEMRKNLSNGNKTRGAKIRCVELDRVWDCAKDASEELGIDSKTIYECARSGRPKTYKGYHWERVGVVETRRKS